MKRLNKLVVILLVTFISINAWTFDSGSTGVDGAFNPTANTDLQLSPSGIFNFTTVNIPAGVTVTFTKNAGNTPVVILASGNAIIAGTIDVRGRTSFNANGSLPGPTDGLGAVGGPGGSDGGHGGLFSQTQNNNAGYGKGLGGGNPSLTEYFNPSRGCGGGGGGYASNGSNSNSGQNQCSFAAGGISYSNNNFFTLYGGSGGGGGAGGANTVGTGGGGGGGSIIIAASGTVTITGAVTANGGNSGDTFHLNDGPGGSGGGGSGGAIRLIATTITGEGVISSIGGQSGSVFTSGSNNTCTSCKGGAGAPGRIQLEAEIFQRATNTTPAYTFTAPRAVFLSNTPSIRIASVGGVNAPLVPTGSRDIVIPGFVSGDPIPVVFATTGVPLGTTVNLTAKPAIQTITLASATSTPVSGSVANGTATANITLANGESFLEASATFNVVATTGADFSKYAQGEQVEKVRVSVNTDGLSETTFITLSGKEYTRPSNAVAMR